MNQETKLNDQLYYSVPDFCKRQGLSHGAIRHILFYRRTNGFQKCVRKIGRKLMIKESDYIDWVESHKEEVVNE